MRPGSVVKIVESFNRHGRPGYALAALGMILFTMLALGHMAGPQIGAVFQLFKGAF